MFLKENFHPDFGYHVIFARNEVRRYFGLKDDEIIKERVERFKKLKFVSLFLFFSSF